jgi:hypothetical protein
MTTNCHPFSKMGLGLGAVLLAACGGPPPELETLTHALTTFPLVCKGGGADPGLSLHEVDIGGGRTRLDLLFFRAATPGSNLNGMPPGSCAWQGRPVAASEPNRICIDDPTIGWDAINGAPALGTQMFQTTAFDWDINRMNRLMFQSSASETFNVANDFAGCLRTK